MMDTTNNEELIMAIEIYLEKGYLTNEDQSLKIINFVDKQK